MPTASASKHDGVTRAKNVCVIPLDRIVRDPNQPREEFDPEALRRLADSLKERGQLQPIGVRWDEALGVYVIVFGERRWRAAGMAGLLTVNAVVMEGAISPDDLIVVQLVENAVREDLRPIEQARAYRKLMDAKGWSTRQVAANSPSTRPGLSGRLRCWIYPRRFRSKSSRGHHADNGVRNQQGRPRPPRGTGPPRGDGGPQDRRRDRGPQAKE